MNNSIVTLGDPVADLIVPVSHLPIQAQEHQSAEDIILEAGGTGNFLIIAARLGLNPTVLGAVGQDYYGKRILEILRGENVNIEHIVSETGSTTSISIGLVSEGDDHVFLWKRPTGPSVSYQSNWFDIISNSDALFTAGHALDPGALFGPETVLNCLEIGRQKKIPIFFDLGPSAFISDRSYIEQTITYVDVILATQEEATRWLEISDPIAAAHKFLDMGLTEVIIKLGPDGCLLVNQKEQVQIPAYKVKMRNAAAAGDAFAAGCVFGFLSSYTLKQIGQLANAIGAASVSKLGTGTRLPQRNEIIEMLTSEKHPITDDSDANN
ncbi:MAG TPA: carbohydrate kinase family protein [Anaerolineales bacterium]|nr:carbohydrate kinase family protein [Anaerolineales bacterium]|tara:strand:+ start:650 stop:1621 length:972 start_codon:yes stop_codon:yes gene_type:complete